MSDQRDHGKRTGGRVRRTVVATLGIGIITVAVFMLVEGAAGTFLMAWDVTHAPTAGLQSRQHAVPDTLLGWLNTPGFRDDDMYGPGHDLVINSLSIRDRDEAPPSEPGVLRIICSGDSFTFGVGTGNDYTWCELLEKRHPRIRTLNFGHAGYGADQAYLRYRRDAAHLGHDVHIFAFIPDDIRRVRLARFAGYDKPYYSIENGHLELRNVPVPELSGSRARTMRAREALSGLHVTRFADRLSTRLRGEKPSDRPNTDAEARMIAVELMDSLHVESVKQGRLTLFVLLPQTYNGSPQFDDLAAFLRSELALRGLPYVDLRAPARTLPADSLNAMFNPQASGHFSIRGNERIAEGLWQAMFEMPAFQERLDMVRD